VDTKRGISLVEALGVMAVLAILASIAVTVVALEPHRSAAAMALHLRQERLGRVAQGSGDACIVPAGTAAATVRWPARGLLFTPDGLPRTCDGGGVGNTTILLEYRGRQAAVIVSSLGRVRWEMR
jgi:hypothetical protein